MIKHRKKYNNRLIIKYSNFEIVECKLGAFINATIYNVSTQDSLHLWTKAISVCTKKQCTQHLLKHTFFIQIFSIYQTMYILFSLHAWLDNLYRQRVTVFSIWKSPRVLQKARKKIVTRAIYTSRFSYTYTPLLENKKCFWLLFSSVN